MASYSGKNLLSYAEFEWLVNENDTEVMDIDLSTESYGWTYNECASSIDNASELEMIGSDWWRRGYSLCIGNY